MRILSICLVVLCTIANAHAQKYVVSGIVRDEGSGETLISANIYEASSLEGTISNNYGFYSLSLDAGPHTLICSYMGFQPMELEINLQSDTTIYFDLEANLEIEEVVVSDKSPEQRVRSTQMSMVELPIIQSKKLPILLGEVDVLKSLQLMPGVQSGTEGSTGLYVRGGGPDQNLVLLDGVPVYNANHLFGFFSVFNADAIKSVSLVKGGFPARYGGRLSSVIDIRMKEGNMKEFKGEASIGLLASKLTVEGPIKKDKTSFIVSGRRTYFDIFTYPVQWYYNKTQLDDDERAYAGFFFYDLNAKVNHIVNRKNRLFLSAYFGKDKFYLKDKYKYEDEYSDYYTEYDDEGGLRWGNATVALRWNHLYSNRLFSNLTATFSDYTFTTFYEGSGKTREDTISWEDNYNFKYFSRIRDYSLRYDFEYSLNTNHYLRFGVNNTLHLFSPGVTVYSDDGDQYTEEIDTTFGNRDIPTNEFFAYVEDEISIGEKLKVNLGLHYSNYAFEDTLYHSLQPRISARYLLMDNLSVKASYVRMAQYLNLLSNNTIGLPTDLWVPSTKNIHPQRSWQAAIGLAMGISDRYEITIEGFYKKMENLVEYREGFSFFSLQNEWETAVTQGEGESYGMELFLQKTKGKTSGWIGYTLSWSYRQFDDISFGKRFPYTYDRRHDLSVVLTHEFSPTFNVGLAWIYGTGNSLTLADEYYPANEYVMNRLNSSDYYGYSTPEVTGFFETRNSYRKPAYHRLDVGFNFPKKKERFERVWSFGVYNVYARKNPFFIYSTEEYDGSMGETKPVLKQVSLLNFVPYLRYSISF